MAKVLDTPENKTRCICAMCPSYPNEGTFFCAHGKTAAKVKERGCICGECSLFREYDLADGYYCVEGRAGEGPQ